MPKYPYRILGTFFDRLFRTDLNDNFADIATDLSDQDKRINNIVANTGNANTEIVDARQTPDGKVYQTLRKHMDAIHATLTSNSDELVDLSDYFAQLQSVYYNGKMSPYFIECLADFSWNGSAVPSNLTPYAGGNYFLGISGNVGDSFVTVKSGNISDAGTTRKWACVIKDDSGNWKPYLVEGTDGVNKVNIYPPLKNTITNGELGNVHDVDLGQHYTERGYFALAQHIYNAVPTYAEKNKYIRKFKGRDGSSNSPWTKIGGPFLNYAIDWNIHASGVIKAYDKNTFQVYCYGNGTTQGVEWEQNVSGKTGYLETFVGVKQDVTTLKVEFYLDGVLNKTVTGLGKEVKRLIFPFKNNTTAKIRILVENCAVVTEICISDTTFWVNEKENSIKLIPPHSKVVYLGDSWGTFHNKAITRELERLLTKDTGTTLTVINHAVGGMTTAWAKAWFEEYVLKEKPTHVIIEYFVNDYNSGNGSNYGNYTAPDGLSYPLTVNRDQWIQNIKDMIGIAISKGIQPIIVCPCMTASTAQSQGIAEYNPYLTVGQPI